MSEYEHKVAQQVMKAVKELADKLINEANLKHEGDMNVREYLNENMRFWK